MVSVDDRDALDRAFERLSPQHRAVFVLHHHAGLPLAEIADIVGVPVGTVKSRLHHGTRTLRVAIEPITIDGHAGRIATNDPCAAAEAFVVVDGRIYGFGVWRANEDPLFRAFLSTVRFPQGGAPDSLSAASFATPSPLSLLGWKTYHSDQYDFTWATRPAGLWHRRTAGGYMQRTRPTRSVP
jgi:hypothetical protein